MSGCICYEARPRLTELKLSCTSTTRCSIVSATELSRSSRDFKAKTEVFRVYSESIKAA